MSRAPRRQHVCVLLGHRMRTRHPGADVLARLQAGDGQKIFGSVQPSDVVDFVEKQTGRKLDESKMSLPKITRLGTYEGSVQLHEEGTGTFKVQVTRQPN